MKTNEITKKDKKELKLSEKDYHILTNKFLHDISDSLIQGKQVKLRGFGTLTIKLHKSKNGRNPKTGESIKIPSKKAIKFIPSKYLKTQIQNCGTKG